MRYITILICILTLNIFSDTLYNFDDENGAPEINESYHFTENELKEIVTVSVQKALEKSIASSLVELAVSELKSHVTQMDQN